MQQSNCAIIGGGIIGITAALELQNRGLQVTLFDRNAIGLGASFGNAGFLACESINPLPTMSNVKNSFSLLFQRHGALALPLANWRNTAKWLALFLQQANSRNVAKNQKSLHFLLNEATEDWKKLLKRYDLSHHLIKTFYMRTWESADGIATAQAEQAFYQQWNIEAKWANRECVRELQPYLADTVHHAVLLPYAHRVQDPYALCLALFDAFLKRGGQFVQTNIQYLKPVADGMVLFGEGQKWHFQRAMLCAGAHSHELLKDWGLNLPLIAERGYHLTLPDQQYLLNGPICSAERNIFVNPLECGLRVTGFSELANTKMPAYLKRYQSLKHHIEQLLPAIRPALNQAKQWVGMRPTLPDSLPIIDVHPHYPQLGMAFGHQHLGLTLAARSAKLSCDLLLNQSTELELKAFRADRFAWSGQWKEPSI
ncbi:MAG: FAD-dependent oxidoreductase [Neisseria sp.]|nr:FAD-dependent oxidoreductase [Neisseria sp.]